MINYKYGFCHVCVDLGPKILTFIKNKIIFIVKLLSTCRCSTKSWKTRKRIWTMCYMHVWKFRTTLSSHIYRWRKFAAWNSNWKNGNSKIDSFFNAVLFLWFLPNPVIFNFISPSFWLQSFFYFCTSLIFKHHINPFSLALSHIRKVSPFVILVRLIFILTLFINLPLYLRIFLSNDIPTARTGRACRGAGRRRGAGAGEGAGTKNGEYERCTQTVGASQLLTRVPQTVRTSFRRFLSRFWCESKSSIFLQHLSVYDLTSQIFMFLMFSLALLFIL